MEFPSNILSIFNQHAGTQTPRDGSIIVPRMLQPTVVIPEIINEMSSIGDQTAIQRTSFVISNSVEQTNAVGGTTLICSIGPGLWMLDLAIIWMSNYTAIAVGQRNTIRLVSSPIASNADLFSYYPLTNMITQQRRFTIAVPGNPNSFFSINFITVTNGVGQTLNTNMSIVGDRIG